MSFLKPGLNVILEEKQVQNISIYFSMRRICNTVFLLTLVKSHTIVYGYKSWDHISQFETLFVLIDKGILLKSSLSVRGSDKHDSIG